MSWYWWLLIPGGVIVVLFLGFYLGIRFIFSESFISSFMDGLTGGWLSSKKPKDK